MTHAIRIHKTGGPEVLSWEEVQLGKPGPGEARIRHTAVGLNFVDVYNRMGLYPQPLPSGLGGEGAGVVEDTGGPLGAYSEARLIPAERLVVLPKGISDHQAAAMMLKGLTAQYLIRQTYRVKAGDTILSMLRPVASASSPANGRSIWAPPLSARSAMTRRRSSPNHMAAIM